jgi:hypothetical protein
MEMRINKYGILCKPSEKEMQEYKDNGIMPCVMCVYKKNIGIDVADELLRGSKLCEVNNMAVCINCKSPTVDENEFYILKHDCGVQK